MSSRPIARSPDLKRLRDEGYEIEIDSGYLVLHHVPYVTSAKKVAYGTLFAPLELSDDRAQKPARHVVLFAGEYPCNMDGSEISQIRHKNEAHHIRKGLVAQYAFSNKPKGGYADFYDKMTRYVDIISAPARGIDPTATAKTFKVISSEEDAPVFHYLDTSSSRAGITVVSDKLKGLRIGIIGLGGTGSYVLDLVAKTHVKEIHVFDADRYLQHNAFRSPGAASREALEGAPLKVTYYDRVYSAMRTGIVPHACRIDASNAHLLDGLDFAFVCVDTGESRRTIMAALQAREIPFVDVGMGVLLLDEQAALVATVRVTAVTKRKSDHVGRRVSVSDAGDDDYRTNIQTGELNAANAALAVLKWKKIFGVYQDLEQEHHSSYSTNNHLLTRDEAPDAA